jgi:uncharacterized phage protein (TIGR01671 family)
MNKLTKFRIWDKEELKFLINDHTKNIEFNLWDWAEVMSTCLLFPIDSYIFQQYTGLTDSKGKEIYEGDIVKYKTWKGRHDGITEENQTQVQFKNGAYYPRYINDECEDSWHSFKVYDLEVVGNVFETPHLDENN